MRQINYQVWERPHGSKTWTRTHDSTIMCATNGKSLANISCKRENAEKMANFLNGELGKTTSFTVFECKEVGFTCSVSGDDDAL